MRAPLAVLLLLTAGLAQAEDAYVTDDLLLTVYSDKNQQGTRVATLHSGTKVEVLGHEGEYAQIRLTNGDEGWVRSSFLVDHETGGARLKAMEQELARLKSAALKPAAPTPAAPKSVASATADAALRTEADSLRQQLDAKQREVDALKTQSPAPPPAASRGRLGPAIVSGLLCLAAGFGWGYMTLARRIRAKFGGVKVF
ncbi:MAG: TIGR04211 family SH3 domain-containing protein [Proteobacteria bacterium]|nr:TIGR04211 family SH3 domain-containing protein [Pseudomonadota bacterium]